MPRFWIGLALSTLAICLPCPAFAEGAGSAGAPQPRIISEAPVVQGTTIRLQSQIMGEVRQINIWAPPECGGSGKACNVVYLLDGGLDQDFPHIAGLAQLASLSGTMAPMIVVGVRSGDRQAELTSPPHDERYRSAFPRAGGAERFRHFLRAEVVPLVESRFRVSGRRALIGESLAGLFVIDTLLAMPQMFDDYIAASPSLWWDDRAQMRRAHALLHAHPPLGRRLYLAVANEGGTMQDGVDRLRAALASEAPTRFALNYVDKSATETHATIYHGAALEAFRWLYGVPEPRGGEPIWFMIEGASPPPAPN